MTSSKEIAKNLWSFTLPLPKSPLKGLNCYVVKAPEGGRELLVDTGFNVPECTEALMSGIEALGLVPENTDVFLTHVHSDHTGNAAYLEKLGFSMIMGAVDYDFMCTEEDVRWSNSIKLMLGEGLPYELTALLPPKTNSVPHTSGMFKARKVYNGDILKYGDYFFECLLTPGHSPGHMCLLDKENKIVLLGDHVLFDITPNICAWTCMYDSLGMYLESLKKVHGIKDALPLPAHRAVTEQRLDERIDELVAHHERRLAEAERIVCENPGANAYRIASQMTWSIKAASWDAFPPGQKYFALSETVAHLDRLVISGKIIREQSDGKINIYYK